MHSDDVVKTIQKAGSSLGRVRAAAQCRIPCVAVQSRHLLERANF